MSKEITLSNIKNFIEGNIRLLSKEVGVLSEHLKEQVAYRMLKCPDCLRDKQCRVCGCSVPGRMYSTTSCNHGERFPDLMGEEDWNKYKKDNEIQ